MMVISKTPFRISLFGGGTDYSAWFRNHHGAVLGTTIDKYCYIMLRPLPQNFENRYRIVYKDEEFVSRWVEIRHPVIRECLRFCKVEEPLEIIHWSDMPARKGMGTSSAFTVGLLNALNTFQQINRPLIDTAAHIEMHCVKDNVGWQDIMHASIGGCNLMWFNYNGHIWQSVNPKRLQDYLMLFDAGGQRIASAVAKSIIDNIPQQEQILQRMARMPDEALKLLNMEDYLGIGLLLNEAWSFKKQQSPLITNERIDAIYDKATGAGAIGGKLLGAGAAGYMVFFVPPGDQESVRTALQLPEVKFEFSHEGSKIIYALD